MNKSIALLMFVSSCGPMVINDIPAVAPETAVKAKPQPQVSVPQPTEPSEPEWMSEVPPPEPEEEPFEIINRHVETGTKLYMDYQYQQSAQVFNKLLRVTPSSPLVNIIAYWYLSQCYAQMNNKDLAAQSSWDFQTAAEDLIEKAPVYDHPAVYDFIKNFELESRITQSKNYVERAWLNRDDSI